MAKRMMTAFSCIYSLLAVSTAFSQGVSDAQDRSYLLWNEKQAIAIGRNMRQSGRVAGERGLLNTDRAQSYKVRATWLTPDVIRATARLEQIRSRLTDEEAMSMVADAEAAGDTVIMVEIDPNEGSGVIPSDWQAFLQPKGVKAGEQGAVAGVSTPKLREVKSLAGVMKRDYDYDLFWVVFPLVNEKGEPVFSDSAREAELVVRIYSKEGKVSWPIPDSIRQRINDLKKK